jgi:hypothetical protein
MDGIKADIKSLQTQLGLKDELIAQKNALI